MPSIEETPLPQPPQPLAGLNNREFALAVFDHPEDWFNYMNDFHAHAEELQQFAVDIKAQLDETDDEDDPAREPLPSPARSQPQEASSADVDNSSDIWVNEYTLSVSGDIPISKMLVFQPPVFVPQY